MNRKLRRRIEISLGWFLVLSIGLAVSLMALLSMSKTLKASEKVDDFWVSLGEEIIQAGLFGGILAVLLNNLLARVFEEGPEAILQNHGIQNLHPSRERFADLLVEWIRDPSTTQISIIGISLRDFLPPGGRLHHAWQAIRERLEFEQSRTPPPLSRLRVKIMLLNPQSAEGMFRYRVESTTLERGNLQEDVENSILQFNNALARIYRAESSEFLELRLYEHGSFAFTVVTDEHALIEQYCYRDHTLAPAFPLIQYPRKSQSYKQLQYSFEVMWQYARPVDLALRGVGTARSVHYARIRNIYRHDDRASLGERELESIRNAQPGQMVRIGAITARYYLRDARETLHDLTSPGARQVSVRLLIINPVSEAAIVRAITESGEPARVRDALNNWDWTRHRRSPLYHDATNTLETVLRLRQRGHSIELRLTPVAPTCAILQTPDAAFVEQYLPGRSRRFERGGVLGGEYPVFEFAAPLAGEEKTMEEDLLDGTFDLLWDHLSLSVDDYHAIDDERQFATNLKMLKASLAPGDPAVELASEMNVGVRP
ncbi:MAG TPA: hypothetical protein VFS20_22915 [Longimicrobium sp.]|nr:hypothetical protein [Longimicrobium sp.]